MPSPALVADGLVKVFPGPQPVRAVDGVSFSALPGEVFGLLGPNGAGKTTTLRMLVTLLTPDAGRASVAGHDVVSQPDAVRASVGYLATTTGVYGRLTAFEMIETFARIQGVDTPRKRAEELIERFDLSDYRDQRCARLSTGNKQKVSIARAIVHDPPVLVLDEPTTGLDVLVAQTFLGFVEEMREAGKCIIYSTHIMSEVERLCDRIGVIHHGRVLAAGTQAELSELTGEEYLDRVFLALVERGASGVYHLANAGVASWWDLARAALDEAGIHRAFVTLHVGAGTFLPVKADDTDAHKMHAEIGHVDEKTAQFLNEARARGGRIVSVGTTSLRLLESAASEEGTIEPWSGATEIFITPGYRFKAIDVLMTNFHLPRSTLFMLVSAFSGLETMQAAYRHAIGTGYRFYSYGDSCLLFPQETAR